MSALGFEILQKKATLEIDVDKLGTDTKTTSKSKKNSILNDEVFEKFRALRLEISSKEEVPAYVVFSDKILLEFSKILPQTKEDMLAVNGVGEVKFKKYGEDFLALCHELKQETTQVKEVLKPLSKTYTGTLELIKSGKNLQEISEDRELQINTILGHITQLHKHEEISNEEKDDLFESIREEFPPNIKKWCEQGLTLSDIQDLRQQLGVYQQIFT